MTPDELTKEQVTAWMGWSSTTIWRKVKQGCFRSYRSGHRIVHYRRSEITYYLDSIGKGTVAAA